MLGDGTEGSSHFSVNALSEGKTGTSCLVMNALKNARFTVAFLKIQVFWDVMLCHWASIS
jgi:hypothetical protein